MTSGAALVAAVARGGELREATVGAGVEVGMVELGATEGACDERRRRDIVREVVEVEVDDGLEERV